MGIRAVAPPGLYEAARTLIARVRQRAYAAFQDFRQDLMAYLEAVHSAHQTLPHLAAARQAGAEALEWLRADYWQRYLFHADTELAGLLR